MRTVQVVSGMRMVSAGAVKVMVRSPPGPPKEDGALSVATSLSG